MSQSNFECATLYQGQSSTGYQVVFTKSKLAVSVVSNGGTMWVRPRPAGDVPGAVPTTPVPSNGAVAAGWIRLLTGQSAQFGDASNNGIRTVRGAPGATAFLDVWCEATGDLVCVSE